MNARLSFIDGFALGSINTLSHNSLDGGFNVLIAIKKIYPGILDSLGCKKSGSGLRNGLTADASLHGDAGSLAERHRASGSISQSAWAQIDADEGRAFLGDVVEDLVGGDLGLVVVGENAIVDLLMVRIPLAGRPPKGTGAAGTKVGDEEKTGDGGDSGGCVDEVDGSITVNFEGLLSVSKAVDLMYS